MESKKHAFSDQILSPRRKVVSGFGVGVVVSVIVLTLILFNCSLKAPIINPMFQGFSSITANSSLKPWPFSFSNPLSSGTANITSEMEKSGDLNGKVDKERVQYKTHDTNISNSTKIEDFLVPNGEGLVLKNTHLVGNFTEMINNGSFSVEQGNVVTRTHEADAPEVAKKGNFTVSNGEEMVTEKTHLGNISEVMNNGSFSSEEGRLIEKMPQGNSSQEGNSSKICPKENVITEATNSSENSLGKSLDFLENNNDGKVRVTEKRGKGSYEGCDIFDGRWVRDDSKPYYPAGSCPYIDRDFDCYLNGRPDDGFLKWKWQPNGCDIPSLNATDFLERLRGKKLVFVGDSLNRNMWESLVCILRHSIRNKKRVHEISGRREFKKKGFYAFRFEDYNCTVDFVSAPFLVRESSHKGRNGTFETLRLDLMDQTTSMYHDADVVVFNTGHWWTHEKTSRGEDYYQEGNYVHPRLKVLEAYKRALTTWARWVDKNIDGKRTQVFFRGYSVTHFRGGQWNSGGQCNKEVDPIFNETYLAKYPSKMRALQYVLQDMKTPVTYLNISRLTDYRKDGHPSIYRMEYKTTEERISAEHTQDCSHWCLPGVPDTWNELLYASLLQAGRGS